MTKNHKLKASVPPSKTSESGEEKHFLLLALYPLSHVPLHGMLASSFK